MTVSWNPKKVWHCAVLSFLKLTVVSFQANIISDVAASHEAYDHHNADNADRPELPDTSTANASNTNATDTHAFEELSQGDRLLTTTNIDEIAADNPSNVPDGLGERSVEFESRFSDTSTVVVDRFPFGNPGAPIPGAAQGQSSYTQFRATQGDSTWAPFQSQRDWDVARWAKTHGTTSSAVDEFLAIPEVCAVFKC